MLEADESWCVPVVLLPVDALAVLLPVDALALAFIEAALTAFIEAEAVCISTVELLRTKDVKAMRI